MIYRIYDLDGTVIDSDHRKATLPDGTLDLNHWIENNTPEKIGRDSLLPLVHRMREDYHDKNTVLIVCTARVLSNADYCFFAENNIPFDTILSRPTGLTFSDPDLKEFHIRNYAMHSPFNWSGFRENCLMYDDSEPVLKRMALIGIPTIDARTLNQPQEN